MSRKKPKLEIVSRRDVPGAKGAARGSESGAEHPLVSGRWLALAVGGSIAAAAVCGWLALCLLFWQGNWQLLYHPAVVVERTPASAGLAFDSIAFAVTDTGVPRLKGWWIPAAPGSRYARFTVVYLHGQNGNLGDTIDELARLHAAGANVMAFDYRGYGQSEFSKPSEAHWRQDAEWALEYLDGTRHVAAGSIVLDGAGLGANLALEVAAAHSELAGVIAESPVADPLSAIFGDARARMVPARLLVRDRYDLDAAAGAVRVPLLWLEQQGAERQPEAYDKVAPRKMIVWVNPAKDAERQYEDAMTRWMDGLGSRLRQVRARTPARQPIWRPALLKVALQRTMSRWSALTW
jgi:pimeloyl-ACP methyl ester carboxylesterase